MSGKNIFLSIGLALVCATIFSLCIIGGIHQRRLGVVKVERIKSKDGLADKCQVSIWKSNKYGTWEDIVTLQNPIDCNDLYDIKGRDLEDPDFVKKHFHFSVNKKIKGE